MAPTFTPAPGPDKPPRSRGVISAIVIGAAVVVLVVGLVIVMTHSTSDNQLAASDRGDTAVSSSRESSDRTVSPGTTSADASMSADQAPVISASTTVPVDPETAATNELNAIVAGQHDAAEGLLNSWVPQIDSKQTGMQAEGRTWDNQAILANYRNYQDRYSNALLFKSDEFIGYKPGYWVVVVPETFTDEQSPLDWCSSEGFDRDHCLSHLITHETSLSHTAAYLPS